MMALQVRVKINSTNRPAIWLCTVSYYRTVNSKRSLLQISFMLPIPMALQYILASLVMDRPITSVNKEIWSKFATYFDKYAGPNGQMTLDNVQHFIVDVLGESSKVERDYVMKNMFRVDLDSNGSVSFFQLGAFLFTQHCSQISLQRHHRLGKMKYGHLKKMTLAQFTYLINQAYKFLSVTTSDEQCRKMFESMDADRDNLITYEEYFKMLRINASTKELPLEIKAHNQPPAPKHIQISQRHSKLRKYIWQRLRKLFDAHVKGRSLPVNEVELRALITVITGDFSNPDIDFLFFYLGMSELSNIIKFGPLASRFIQVAARLGLKNFIKNHLETKKNLNKHEFARLLKTSFRYLGLNQFKSSILFKIFEKIDKDNDSWITFDEYMDWVIRYLAIQSLRGGEFLAAEDDLDSDMSLAFEQDIDHFLRRKGMIFSDYSLAKMVRARAREIILSYVRDEKRLFRRPQIEKVVRGITGNDIEMMKYIIAGVYRQDWENKEGVTLTEFMNFLIQLYFGEMAIQRLHFQSTYVEGPNRKMNRNQFKKTLELMLSFISIRPQVKLMDTLFDEIDTTKSKQISYKEYFTFNNYYFGSSSIAALNFDDVTAKMPQRMSEDQYFFFKLKDLPCYTRFKSVMMTQMRQKFKHYHCEHIEAFQLEKIRMMMEHAFKMSDVQIQYIYRKFFNYMAERGRMADLDETIEIILACYFEVHVSHKQTKMYFNSDNQQLITFEFFCQLIKELCHFVWIKPLTEDLMHIFNDMDSNKDAKITWDEYIDFAKNIFSIRGVYNEQLSQTKSTVNSQDNHYENQFIEDIQETLKMMFQKHQHNNRQALLGRHEIESICKEMKIFSNKQIKFILWSLFEGDMNFQRPHKEIDFQRFSSFVLNYIGQLSLEKFQTFQAEPNKNQLKYAEFYLIIHNAYSPLVDMSKYKDTVSKISRKIGKNDEMSYSKYLNWVHESFVMPSHKKMIE